MTDCIIRQFGGCACDAGECRIEASRKEREARAETTVSAKRRSYRWLEAAIVAFYIGVAVVSAITLDNHFKREALINQEVIAYGK